MTRTANPSENSKPIRLHKILSSAGVCSLREAERLIAAGTVTVNGKVTTTKGASADPDQDTIRVDGKVVQTKIARIYIALNKPKGFVTTRSDEKDRRTVMDLLPKEYRSLHPVGRLDLMSEGLLLFTNDGAFTQAILAPKNKVQKVYRVKTRNIPDRKTTAKMVSGVTIDGEKLRAETVTLKEVIGKNCWLEITLTEGKNRHIRRLCETLGHPALKVKRMSIGPVKLGDLKTGEARQLKVEVVNKLFKMAGGKKTVPSKTTGSRKKTGR
ncbi:Ribosomal large subunit pseudouridine synthase B [hydrothermal vent metagenome]|uniref:Ribosomal large subunit pseudouridine synthase B n=1 Tax=hydrothermal vent metagenome TaxID=652676 RepID=A0A3B1CHT5_9ZZZZ